MCNNYGKFGYCESVCECTIWGLPILLRLLNLLWREPLCLLRLLNLLWCEPHCLLLYLSQITYGINVQNRFLCLELTRQTKTIAKGIE